ncbi:low molecular weight phosphatase family protein [Kocuria sabuli]|uniref:arsenate reductase/protein-tyrosine-phosphatase family protein n=1 Tax=Kocuria sabuli TaxID=3071448 RepID=UPI0034D3C062
MAPTRILTVCTGNVCRSPMAAVELDHGLNEVSPGGFAVTSAGMHALVDQGFEERVGRLAHDRGLAAAAGHRARQVGPEILRDVDLVLVMAREHTQPVLQQAPRLLKKVFTLREFARILQYVSTDAELDAAVPADRAERWAWLVRQAPRLRQRVPVRHPERNDVVDPYRQEDTVLQQMADELFEATDAVVAWERRYAQRHRASAGTGTAAG